RSFIRAELPSLRERARSRSHRDLRGLRRFERRLGPGAERGRGMAPRGTRARTRDLGGAEGAARGDDHRFDQQSDRPLGARSCAARAVRVAALEAARRARRLRVSDLRSARGRAAMSGGEPKASAASGTVQARLRETLRSPRAAVAAALLIFMALAVPG